MIVCDRHKFLIGTPTKTGTNALRSCLIERGEIGCYHLLPKHRMDVPPRQQYHFKYLVVRNPYDRLVSMFHYLNKRGGQWGDGHFSTFKEFIRFHQERRMSKPSVDWTNNNVENKRILRPAKVFHQENLFLLLRDIESRFKVELPALTRINVSQDRGPWQDYYDKSDFDVVREWCRQDCHLFGYELK